MKIRTLAIPAAAGFLLLMALPASGELVAHYTVQLLESGCRVDDQDPWPTGDPERYWRMGVFDSSNSSVLNGCASGCTGDSYGSTLDGRTLDYCSVNTGCGTWNFTDQTIIKVIPNGSGVYLYFGLFDEDTNVDDSLGDHWAWAAGPLSGRYSNNNNSPYYADNPIVSVCGRDVDGIGDANNFWVTQSVWFEDSSAPLGLSTPVHFENGSPSPTSLDERLDFQGSATSDPESGIAGYNVSLRDLTTGLDIVYNQPMGDVSSWITFCPSGCNFTFSALDGHTYAFRIGATNGDYPTINNARTSYSDWAMVEVTMSSPVQDFGTIPSVFGIGDPFPNPFNPATTIAFGIPDEGRVRAAIYDLRGVLVRMLVDEVRTAGVYQERWDGRGDDGRRAAAGVYLARIEFGGQSLVRKLAMIE